MKGLHFLRESVPGIGELNDARDCRAMDIDAITDARKAEILRLLDQGVDFDRAGSFWPKSAAAWKSTAIAVRRRAAV